MKRLKNYIRYFSYYILKVFKVLGILDRLNITVSKNVYGVKHRIPVLGSIGLYNLVDGEKWLYLLFKKLYSLRQGSVVDVGINIGQTLLKLKSIDSNVNYYGFEPNPLCVFYANRLAKVNKFSNVMIYPIGLSDSNNILTLYADNEIASGASVLEEFRENYLAKFKYSVPVWNFDELKINPSEIALVKIDVEGFELEVFKGMINLMKEGRPFFVCEILPVYSLESVNGKYRFERQEELCNLLKNCNYRMFLIDEKNMSLVAIDKIEVHGDMNRTNYVIAHKDNYEKLNNLTF